MTAFIIYEHDRPRLAHGGGRSPQPIPANPRFEDLRGRTFDRLTVREFVGIERKHPLWICECSCGAFAVVRSLALKQRRQVSCGCYQAQRRVEVKRKHGESHAGGQRYETVEFTTWMAMKGRCYNPNNPRYHRYGGRGIKVCDRWLYGERGRSGFECFLLDVGRRPSPWHTIDRKDNDGDYGPDNFRWATQREQQRNRGNTVFVVWSGTKIALADLCDQLGIDRKLVGARLLKGWAVDRAIGEPSRWRGYRQ